MLGQVLVARAKLAARLANCLVDRLACLADATHHVAQNEAKSETLICANMRRPYAPDMRPKNRQPFHKMCPF